MIKDIFTRFLDKFREVGGEFYNSLPEFIDKLEDKRIACEETLVGLIMEVLEKEIDFCKAEFAFVSITRPKALVAETGSLLFVYDREEDFKLISLPYVHVNIFEGVPVFETLEEALAQNQGVYVSVVTGPSKTGDIELIHVFGVHGPGRLVGVGSLK
ncbi:MAG: LUD domain-containing protein [Thermosulfidibacteraceae bacterium]|jgi:L-lactate utilization protein LutC